MVILIAIIFIIIFIIIDIAWFAYTRNSLREYVCYVVILLKTHYVFNPIKRLNGLNFPLNSKLCRLHEIYASLSALGIRRTRACIHTHCNDNDTNWEEWLWWLQTSLFRWVFFPIHIGRLSQDPPEQKARHLPWLITSQLTTLRGTRNSQMVLY